MPKVSVVMAVYNTKEEWLREAIESILHQTYTDFEFIIVNDGSTNNAEEVILSYQDDRIKYMKQANQGPGVAANNGIDIAKGEYIARMDSDDISLPQRFEKQVAFLDQNPDVSIVGTDHEYIPSGRIAKMLKYPKYLDFLRGNSIGQPTVMFRRLDFEKYHLRYDPAYPCEDYELWSRAIRYVKFANLQEVLLKYRWHDDNRSKPTRAYELSVKKVRQNMLNFLTTNFMLQQSIVMTLYQMPDRKKLLYQKFSNRK